MVAPHGRRLARALRSAGEGGIDDAQPDRLADGRDVADRPWDRLPRPARGRPAVEPGVADVPDPHRRRELRDDDPARPIRLRRAVGLHLARRLDRGRLAPAGQHDRADRHGTRAAHRRLLAVGARDPRRLVRDRRVRAQRPGPDGDASAAARRRIGGTSSGSATGPATWRSARRPLDSSSTAGSRAASSTGRRARAPSS